MGKKTSQSSEKISKKRVSSTTTDNKKTLNSLIRVLRPKVYITDSSTFKTLVQELTGNGIISTTPTPRFSSPPNSSIISEPTEQVPTIIQENIIEDYATFKESSPDMSFDSSELSVPTTFGTSDFFEELNMPNPFLSTHDQQFQSSSLENNDDMSLNIPPQYGEIDLSWLLEMDPNFVYNYDPCAVPMMMPPPEVCEYDYDLSGIM